jgi:hypothetical protein
MRYGCTDLFQKHPFSDAQEAELEAMERKSSEKLRRIFASKEYRAVMERIKKSRSILRAQGGQKNE